MTLFVNNNFKLKQAFILIHHFKEILKGNLMKIKIAYLFSIWPSLTLTIIFCNFSKLKKKEDSITIFDIFLIFLLMLPLKSSNVIGKWL